MYITKLVNWLTGSWSLHQNSASTVWNEWTGNISTHHTLTTNSDLNSHNGNNWLYLYTNKFTFAVNNSIFMVGWDILCNHKDLIIYETSQYNSNIYVDINSISTCVWKKVNIFLIRLYKNCIGLLYDIIYRYTYW